MILAGQKESPSSPPSSSSSVSNVVNTPGDCSLSSNLGRATHLDDVWHKIFQEEEAVHGNIQKKLEGPTLEDFFVRAGTGVIGNDGETSVLDSHRPIASTDVSKGVIERVMTPPVQQRLDWLQPQQEHQHLFSAHKQQLVQPIPVFGSVMPMFVNTVNPDFLENHQMQPSLMSAVPVNISTPSFLDTQATVSEDVKGGDEAIDKSMERKQKRMIKNRESAARSRAKKQAHITELENKVKRLREANFQLENQKV